MKLLKVREIFGIGMLVLSLSVVTSAQNANNSNARGGDRNDRTETPRVVVREDNDTDWGWLGLLGLLGLAGLIPKKRRVEVQEFRDTNRPAANAGTPQ